MKEESVNVEPGESWEQSVTLLQWLNNSALNLDHSYSVTYAVATYPHP